MAASLSRAQDRPEEPGEARLEVLSAELVQAARTDLALLNEAGLAEHLEVVCAGGLRDRKPEAATGQLVALGQRGDDLQAHRVAERVEHGRELDLGSLRVRDWFLDLDGHAVQNSHCTTIVELCYSVRRPSYKAQRKGDGW